MAQTLTVTVKPGYHVNSDKPKDEYIIPLKLTWTGGPLDAKMTVYPKAEEIQVNGQALTVFTGTFPIQTEFQVGPERSSRYGDHERQAEVPGVQQRNVSAPDDSRYSAPSHNSVRAFR